jgi:hypothetical protein
MSVDPRTREPCDCELPGYFHTGVPGVLAAMEDGLVAPRAIVERCDQCCRFESDAAALARLVELGLVRTPLDGTAKSYTVHCFAVVRVTFPGVLAADPQAAVQQTLNRFCWETHGQSVQFAEEFTRFVVECDADANGRRTSQFDGHLNEVEQQTA